MKRFLPRGLVLCLFALFLPGPLKAQTATGNVYGTVVDDSGAALPGVAVKLTSALGNRDTTVDANGNFHFLNLDHGTYTVGASLTGFATVLRTVVVDVGENVTLSFQLKVASMAETVTVTSEVSMIDSKKVGTALTMSAEELASIPSARDPWAMLRAVPGIIMDRVNIGGNENGQQANFTGKGDNGNNTMWNLDGVVTTDVSSLSSSVYYDFDAFDEVSISTAGSDVRSQTGGIGINLTTRRGTNTFHGSTHYYLEDHKFESQNLPSSLLSDPRVIQAATLAGGDSTLGDHIQELADYGADFGGPIIKDKLWFYGAYGKQDIRLDRINGTRDRSLLASYNGKINWQAGANDMVSVFVFDSLKTKTGRSPGSGLNEDQGFLWNQGTAYASPIHAFVKGEWDHTFSPNLFVAAKYSYNDSGGFLLVPSQGLGKTYVENFVTGQALGNVNQYGTSRPAHTVNLDANYFARGLGASHEFKFGFGYRKFNVTSTSTYGGNQLVGYVISPTVAVANIYRNENLAQENQYWSGYASDTITKDRLTLSLGLRYDNQKSENLPSSVPANVTFPTLVPALDYTPSTPAITWGSFSPRIGLTLALDDSRKTLVRGSYAYYGSQLGTASSGVTNAAGFSYITVPWHPTPGDNGLPLASEVNPNVVLGTFNFDPSNPGSVSSPNNVDPNCGPQRDSEIVGGLEREVAPNLSVSAAYTWRKGTNITTWEPLQGLTTADYVAAHDAGNGYTTTFYNLAPNVALPAGFTLTNRPQYHTNYSGIEFNVIKRLSNHWMGRIGFTYQNPTETLDGPGAVQNPTKTDTSTNGLAGQLAPAGPQINGGLLAPLSSGSGKGALYIEANWQIVANALVQLPWDVQLAGALYTRQGQPHPIAFAETTANGNLNVLTDQAPTLDSIRYQAVTDLDLHLDKTIKLGGSPSLLLSADLFNVFNTNTTLANNIFASSSQFGQILGVLNPRVLRLGLRFRF